MTLSDLRKTPFPYFGGKADAAPAIWAALGDVHHYVEPFAGSLAVLLRRPHQCNRAYHSETVNDADGLLCNAWRSIQLSPDATAEAAAWPVCEADLHARHIALVRWRERMPLERLMGDPAWHDPVMAGWWIWGMSCWIGSGWSSGGGAWTVDADGIFYKQARGGAREPGVVRKLPHIGDDGQGVNHAGAREPGVKRQRPHIGDGGQGVNHAGAREPGVAAPARAREPGVAAPDTYDYHPMTMPEIRRWFAFLSARLRHVRILNGDWRRCVTNGATKILAVRGGDHACGIVLDPPYAGDVRNSHLYATDSESVAAHVHAWCAEHGDDPKLRIVLCGFDTEHVALEQRGWRVVEWYRAGFLKGGYANIRSDSHQHRERLWLSPHCLADAPSDDDDEMARHVDDRQLRLCEP